MRTYTINTEYVQERPFFNWIANLDNYSGGDCLGKGDTEFEAIEDLFNQLELNQEEII
jgi:hypothetical protein